MAHTKHLDILKQGTHAWNVWRKKNPDITPDLQDVNFYAEVGFELSGVNFSGTKLHNGIFGGVNLVQANFRKASLLGAYLEKVHVWESDFTDADISNCDLREADLSCSKLCRSNLTFSNLSFANLTEADLDQAVLGETLLGGVDFTRARNLDTCRHLGPSVIDHQTVMRSGGGVPDEFLAGCGLPASLIGYFRNAGGTSMLYYSCFISYSSCDADFADRLYKDLRGHDVRCWLASADMRIGAKIRATIDTAIRKHDKLLLILSRNSIGSDWVEKEVETAFEEERVRTDTVLFPVRLDGSVMETRKAWAADIRRTRYIEDFSNWEKPDHYSKALHRLLRDLQATGHSEQR